MDSGKIHNQNPGEGNGRILMEFVVFCFGVPWIIVRDYGTQFLDEIFTKYSLTTQDQAH